MDTSFAIDSNNSIKLTIINEQIKQNIFRMSKMNINFSNCGKCSRFRNNRYIINMPIKVAINTMLCKMIGIGSTIDECIF